MGYELVLEVGQKVGQLISKSEEKLWDIDIKNFTVSPLDQIKCIAVFDKSCQKERSQMPSIDSLGAMALARKKEPPIPAQISINPPRAFLRSRKPCIKFEKLIILRESIILKTWPTMGLLRAVSNPR